MVSGTSAVLQSDSSFSVSHFLSDTLGWYLWLLAVPPIQWALARWPLERATWARTAPIHVLAGLTISTGYGLLAAIKSQFVLFLFSGAPLWPSPSLARGHVLGGLPLYCLAYAALLAVLMVLDARGRLQARELRARLLENQVGRLQLDLLKSQLDPHFLFNALNGLATLIHTDPDRAESVVEHIAVFLRASLHEADSDLVSLEDELRFTQLYFEIEETRFGSQVSLQLQIESLALTALVPRFLLQPLVENCIRHGMSAANLHITIAARCQDERVVIEVVDDGVGFSPQAESSGHGLSLTRRRLAHLFPASHHLTMGPNGAEGASVRIELMQKRADAAAGHAT
jgi:LytS/YehU family sensor histidine kinase